MGVNKYRVKEEAPIETLEVSSTVREEQVARIKAAKAKRDGAAVKKALENITKFAEKGGNLLEASVQAMRLRATVGEVSDAMEKIFGHYVATTRMISGVYSSEYGESDVIKGLQKRTENFLKQTGRRPRMLLTKMGQDGHDRNVEAAITILPLVAPGFCGSKVTVPLTPLALPLIASSGASSLKTALLTPFGSLKSKVSGAALGALHQPEQGQQ